MGLPTSIIRAIIAYKINALPFQFNWPITKDQIEATSRISDLQDQYRTLHSFYIRARRCADNRIYVRDHAYTETTRKASYEYPIQRANEQVQECSKLMSLVCDQIMRIEARRHQSHTTPSSLSNRNTIKPTTASKNKRHHNTKKNRKDSGSEDGSQSSFEDMSPLQEMVESLREEAEKRWTLVSDMIQVLVQRLIEAVRPHQELVATDIEDIVLPIFRASMDSCQVHSKRKGAGRTIKFGAPLTAKRKNNMKPLRTLETLPTNDQLDPSTSDLLLPELTFAEFEPYIKWYLDTLGRVLIDDIRDFLVTGQNTTTFTKDQIYDILLPTRFKTNAKNVIFLDEISEFLCSFNSLQGSMGNVKEVIVCLLPVLQLLLFDYYMPRYHPEAYVVTDKGGEKTNVQARLFRRRAKTYGFNVDTFLDFRLETIHFVFKDSKQDRIPSKFLSWRQLNMLMHTQLEFCAWQFWLNHSRSTIVV